MKLSIDSIKQFTDYRQLLPLSDKYPFIGCHLSIQGGFVNLILQMNELKATGCAFFTSTPRGWHVSEPKEENIKQFYETCMECHIGRNQFLPHAPYLINVASDNEEVRKKAVTRLVIDAHIVRLLGLDIMNFHPGSCEGEQTGVQRISDAINLVHECVPDVRLAIETMAGIKSETVQGCSFQKINDIINCVKNKDRVGVCIDTQHTFAGAFVSEDDFGNELIKKFSEVIGTKYLLGFHINGSLTKYGCGTDRHEELQRGFLKLSEIEKLLNHQPKVVCCLETPDGGQYEDEIQLLMKFWNKEK